MYHRPIRDPFVLGKIKERSKMLKGLIKIGEEKCIPHSPIGGNLRVSKKYLTRMKDYHRLSEDYNTQKEINNISLKLLVEILDLVINVIPIKRY